jgi:hypothetical protein
LRGITSGKTGCDEEAPAKPDALPRCAWFLKRYTSLSVKKRLSGFLTR